MDRYARQRLLANIGDHGQERIARASFGVASASPAAAQVEREYLERAGAVHFAPTPGGPVPFPHTGLFEHEVAREFAEGAWRALAQLRSILEHSS
jgi:hypothetical protein